MMKRLAVSIAVVLTLQLAGTCERSPARTADTSSDEFEGAVIAIEKKIKEKRAAADARESEFTGVVVMDPCETATGVSQFRLCTDDRQFINVCMPLPREILGQSGCGTDQRISISHCEETFSGCVVAPADALHTAPACTTGQPQVCTLQNAVATGMITCGGLIGDGTNTASCQMPCTNNTDKPVDMCVPKDQCFEPDHHDCQSMMCTDDTVATVPPHKSVKINLPTMCISPHSVNPPPAKGRQYKPKPIDDCQFYRFCDHLLTLSRYLEEDHYYDQVPIPPERRKDTVCQLAQWMEQARLSGLPKDKITPQSIRSQLLEKGNVNLESLSAEDVEKLDGHCQRIFKAAELTYKLATDRRMAALIAGTGAGKGN